MKTRKALVAATATATPAAHAEIVAPEPSSRLEIPAGITDFFQSFSALPRHETEQVIRIGAAWILISTTLSLASTVLYYATSSARASSLA